MNGTSILVVEDEETLAESLRYNLIREGYEVTVVDDGRLPSTPSGPRLPILWFWI